MERQAFARWQKRKGIPVLGLRHMEHAEYSRWLSEISKKPVDDLF